MTTTYNQKVQDALTAMQVRYDELESWIATIEADTAEIERLTPQLMKKEGWWIFKDTVVDMNVLREIEENQAEIDEMNAKIAAANSGNSSFIDLTDSIEDCLDTMTTAENKVSGKKDTRDAGLLMQDLKVICEVLEDLVDALQQQVQVQIDGDAMTYLKQNDGSSSDIMSLSQKAIADQGKQSDILTELRLYLNNTAKEFNEDWNEADIDMNGIRWYHHAFGFGADERKWRDEAIKRNATEMIQLSHEVKNNTTELLASYTPGLMQITAMLSEILKKLGEILRSDLSPEERQQAVMEINQEIMKLFVQIVGLLALVEQQATTDKAKNEAKMSEATNEAALIGMSNSRAQWKKIEQDLAYAAAMGILMQVAKYSLMVLGSLAAPGVSSMLVGLLLIALEASGATKALTEELSKSMGNLGAELFIAGFEMVLTMGGGAAIDAMAKQVMEKMTVRIAQLVTANAARGGAKIVAENIDEAAAKMVMPAIEQAAKQGAEQAAKKVFVTYFEQNGLNLFVEWVKEAVTSKGLVSGIEEMVFKTMKEAAEDAAKTAAEEAGNIISIAGKSASGESAKELVEKTIQVAKEAGDAAAARAMKMSLDDVAKTSLNETAEEIAWTTGKRALASGTYAVGANNILVDSVKALTEAKEDKDENSALLLTMEILQSLLMILGQLGGSGTAGQWMKDLPATGRMFNKAASGLSLVATSAETVAAGSQYGIDMKQAEAVEAMAKLQTVLDILQQVLAPQIDARNRATTQHGNDVFVNMVKSNTRLASQLNAYLNTSANVLLG